jgi:hypothetical protein
MPGKHRLAYNYNHISNLPTCLSIDGQYDVR